MVVIEPMDPGQCRDSDLVGGPEAPVDLHVFGLAKPHDEQKRRCHTIPGRNRPPIRLGGWTPIGYESIMTMCVPFPSATELLGCGHTGPVITDDAPRTASPLHCKPSSELEHQAVSTHHS